MNHTIAYTTYPSKAIEIEKALKMLGITYDCKYNASSVPCQSTTRIIVKPKSNVEFCAVYGLIS